ncbi:glycoside hydrolase family 16 protein [Butyriboletus roseoflavus]|nr:glycoside hydrolase family 16 protein [Butyriboletus roseoflavus]
MTKSLFPFTLLGLTVAVNALGAKYNLTSSLTGQSFFDAFDWQIIPDPTNGRVCVHPDAWSKVAKADGLYSIAASGVVTLRADNTTVLSASGPGRNSFNLISLANYTTHVAIFDIVHMPQGCGTWPAVYWYTVLYAEPFSFQEVGLKWPDEGEIDIVEGVNDQGPDTVTLHTSGNCTLPSTRTMTGYSLGLDCDVWTTGNSGCGVLINDTNSFGPPFNNIGGGWYAIERSATYISIYFWERGSTTVPCQVVYPESTVDTSTWGTPSAYFPNTDCNFATHLGAMNIVIDLTFCGDWAGSVYGVSGCPSTCVDYVNSNPSAFTDAYFEFNALTIYE